MANYPKKAVSNPTLDALVTEYARHKNTAKTESEKADALKKSILDAADVNPDELVNYEIHGRGEFTTAKYLITRVDKTIGYPDGVEAEIATLKARIAELEKLKVTAFCGRYDLRPAK